MGGASASVGACYFRGCWLATGSFSLLGLLANPGEVFGEIAPELGGDRRAGIADFLDDGIGVHGAVAEAATPTCAFLDRPVVWSGLF